MTNGEFRIMMEKRTVDFSERVLKLIRRFPVGVETRNIKDQLCRAATSIGANYREANRAESRDDFLHKIAIAAKEAAETEYWLMLAKDLYPQVFEVPAILVEAGESVRIFDKIRFPMTSRKA